MTAIHPGRAQLAPALPANPLGVASALARRGRAVLPLAAGVGCWAYSLTQIRLSSVGTEGLLFASGPWILLGLFLVVAGFAFELAGRANGCLLTVYLVALVAMIQATIPLLTHTPEYSWVYKHIGVADSFRVNGRVTDPTDIYQQWPAFFALVAGVTSAAGTSAVQLALWAPLAFELTNCLLLVAVFRTLTTSRTVPFLAAFLFEALTTWVGQDYLSPQAFAFVLWLAVILITLRWLAPAPSIRGTRARLYRRLQCYLTRGFAARPLSTLSHRRLATFAVVAVFAVIVVAHQLTPVIALTAFAGLTVAGVVRPRWLVAVLAAVAGAFVASRYHLISTEYGGLFSGGDVVSNASGAVHSWHSVGQIISAEAVRGVAVVMWGATALLILWRWRTPGRVILPAILALSPFSVLLGQSYGGEAIYRVFLFSAPWCAFLIASTLVQLPWARVRRGLYLAVPGGLLLASLQGLWGPVSVNAFTSRELGASLYLYHHAPADSAFILADQNFPALETARYDDFDLQVIPSDPEAGLDWLDSADLHELDAWVESLHHADDYLVMSRSMISYAEYYGFPDGFEQLAAELPHSPAWTVWYRNADVTVYRYRNS